MEQNQASTMQNWKLALKSLFKHLIHLTRFDEDFLLFQLAHFGTFPSSFGRAK